MYWRLLSDDSPVMAGQAYRLIQKYRISYNALRLYECFMQNRGSVSGECFLKLLLCAPSWQRLPYLLLLYCDEELSDEWRCSIVSKIHERNPYAKIPRQQAQEICDILKQKGQLIPPVISERIWFDLRYVVK